MGQGFAFLINEIWVSGTENNRQKKWNWDWDWDWDWDLGKTQAGKWQVSWDP